MQPISPNYNLENVVKQIKITKETFTKSCVLCLLLRTKTLASGSKCIKHFFIFTTICLISAEWMSGWDLFNMPCLSRISLMASLDSLCSNHPNVKNNITKIEHNKIFCGPSKILKNISLPINKCLKFFMRSTKILRPLLLHTKCTVPNLPTKN